MTGKTKKKKKRLKLDFGRFSALMMMVLLLLGRFPGAVALAEEETVPSEEEPEILLPDETAPTGRVVLTDAEGGETVWEDLREAVEDAVFLSEKGTIRIEAEDDQTSPEELTVWVLTVKKEEGKYPVFDGGFLENVDDWEPVEGPFSLENGSAAAYIFKVVDNAGNSAYFNTDGIIIDAENPKVYISAETADIPTIDGKIAQNGDLSLEIAAEDPFPGGIDRITWVVTADGKKTQEGELYLRKEEEDAPEKWSDTILLPAKENEGEDVRIRVTAVDRSGNEGEAEYVLTFDTTAPVLRIDYDNNEVTEEGVFAAPRRARFTVEERHFAPALAEVLVNGSPAPVTWERAGEDRYQAEVLLQKDGVYRVEARCTDLAGNRSEEILPALGTKFPHTFTIDTEGPHILVLYENASIVKKNVSGGPFFVDINIFDANLAENTVEVELVRTDMENIGIPMSVRWEKMENGLAGRCSVEEDGVWQFRIRAGDRAGNRAEAWSETVTVDLTSPVIRMEGIDEGRSYRGEAIPVIVFSDVNPDPSSLKVTLRREGGREKEISGSWETAEEGNIFRCVGFPQGKDWDGRYELTAEMKDLAGRSRTETVSFTLNRFGSDFRWAEEAESLRNRFVREVPDLVLTETNLDLLTERSLTLFRDGLSHPLEEGKDYLLEQEDEGEKHRYTYRILRRNFAGEGSYQLRIRTADAAGNTVSEEAEILSTTYDIYVDETPPSVDIQRDDFVSDLEGEGEKFLFRLFDRGGLESFSVTSGEDGMVLFEERGEALRKALKEEGSLAFAAPEEGWETLLVTAEDRAGNRTKNRIVRTGRQVEIEEAKPENRAVKTAPAKKTPEEDQAEKKIELAKKVGADLYEVREETRRSPAVWIALALLAGLVLFAVLAAVSLTGHRERR